MSHTNLSVRRRLSHAVLPVVCEGLESRRLLTSYVYDVPLGVSIAYILPKSVGGIPGQVEIRLGSLTANPVFPFDNDTGLDIIRVHSSVSNFVFVDAVPADLKPRKDTSTPNDPFGIQVEGGSDGHLIIEAGQDDHLIRVVESTATNGAVEIRPDYFSGDIGNSRFATGVNKLTVQTHASGDAVVRVATQEPNFSLPGPLSPPPVFGHLPGLHSNTTLRIESLGARDEIHLGGAVNASVHAKVHTGKGENKVFLLQNKSTNAYTTTADVDFDPTLGGGLGSGHLLKLGSDGTAATGLNCRATLKQLGSTAHVITIDDVFASNHQFGLPGVVLFPATVVVSERTIMGDLVVPKDEAPTFADPLVSVEARLDVEKTSAGVGTDGIARVEGRMEFKAASNPSTVYKFAVEGDNVESSTGVVSVESGADVTILAPTGDNDPSSRIGTVNFPGTTNTGKLTLQARPDQSQLIRVLVLRALSMGGTVGQLDLTNGAMIVNYTDSTPHDSIKSLITSGYNGGAWTGNGIRSSTAETTALNDGIGYAERTEVASTFPDGFLHQYVDNTCVLLRYTYDGDVNLDGQVILQDFNALAANFGQFNRNWIHGDSNYDGTVNLVDFNRLAANFGMPSFGPGEDEGDGGEGFGDGGEPQYTYDELFEMLVELNPEDF